MIRHQLFERVPIAMARGKKVRCQRLDEMNEGVRGPFVRSGLVAMEVAHGVRFDAFAGTALLKCIKIITSSAASIKNTRGGDSRVLALYDISGAFWHALLPEDEPIAMYPPRGEEEAGYMWQVKRAMYGTRRASRLFQEHMKGVLKEAGYAALKVCHQVYHCLETDSMAAIRGDDIIAEGEPEKLDRVEVLKQVVVFKVLDRVGPRAAEHGEYLKRHIVYINGQGFEWLEDPKHLAAIIRNSSKVGAKPQSSPGSKDLGKSDPEALDELEEVEGKLYQQDTGISTYVSSGRFDIQFCSEMMTKPRKLGNLRLARLARYLVGTEKLVLRFDHQEYGDTENCSTLRLGWKRGTPFHARRTEIPWRTSRGFVGCIRPSASIEFRRSRALRNRGSLGTRNLHKAHVREMGTNHQHRRRNGLDGCDRDVFPNGRWKDQTYPSSLVVDPRRHS